MQTARTSPRAESKGSSKMDMLRLIVAPDHSRSLAPRRSGQFFTVRPLFAPPDGDMHAGFVPPYAALPVTRAAVGRPSSIGSDGSRDHSFQDPKYIRTSFTPAFFSARKGLEARAPLKQ